MSKSFRMRGLYRTVLALAAFFFKVFYRHKVYGKEHWYQGGGLIAANHTSFFDPPLVAISCPEEVHFLARETLFAPPLFGRLIRALNAHPVRGDTGDLAVLKQICVLLQEGKKVILFPEGTRAEENQLGEIKPGIGMLVARAQSAVIPTYIHGAFAVWSRHRLLPRLFGKTTCVFGSPIRWTEFAHLEKKTAQKALAEKLHSSIIALKSWYEEGCEGVPP